ncbi:protein of unknown function [Pseudomonas mediterranea]
MGAKLARDGLVTFNVDVDGRTAIASKLCPHWPPPQEVAAYSELQRWRLGRHFHALLAARADQLYLNFLGGREGFEQRRQVEVLQSTGCGAGELVVGVDFAVFVVVLVAVGVFVVVFVIRFIAEQWAFQFLLGQGALGRGRQVEQRQWLLKLPTGRRDLGLVGIAGGFVFKAHQVHGRAFQLQLQGLAVERCVQSADAVFMGAQAAVLMIVVMVVLDRGVSDGQWQQGERQSEKQTTHDESPDKMNVLLCNLITNLRRV